MQHAVEFRPSTAGGLAVPLSLALALALALSMTLAPPAVRAADVGALPGKTCASQSVYASGEPASYEWLARIKTHANWRSKVRVMPGLGDPYANWKRAEDTTERCFSGPAGTVCQFTGIPCRQD